MDMRPPKQTTETRSICFGGISMENPAAGFMFLYVLYTVNLQFYRQAMVEISPELCYNDLHKATRGNSHVLG